MPAPTQGSRPRPPGPGAGDAQAAGLQFAIVLGVFVAGGLWLDGKFGTTPWLLIAGVLVGGGGGFWSMYRRLVIEPRQRAGSNDKDKT